MQADKRIKYRYFLVSFTVAFLVLSLLFFVLAGAVRPGEPMLMVAEPVDEYYPERGEALSALFVGVGESGEAGAFLLARLDPARGAVPLVALPLETAVRNRDKTEALAEVYRYGGADYARRALAETLGIDIDRYVRLELSAFYVAAATVGTVEYELPYELSLQSGGASMTLSPGQQLLDGRGVAEIMRYAGYPGGEETRCSVISGVAAAIVDQRRDIVLSTVADKVFEKLVNLVDTDISYTDYDDRRQALEYLARREGGIAAPIRTAGSFSADGKLYTLSDTFVALLTQAFS